MKILIPLYLLLLLSNTTLFGQTYSDHFGKGNNIGVSPTSSPVSNSDSIQSTLSGTGYLPDTAAAARFLAQAGFGGSPSEIDTLIELGIENWIDWQMTMPYQSYFNRYFAIKNDIAAGSPIFTNNKNYTWYTPMVFYDKVINDEDIFRQKAAFALSQILVVRMITTESRQVKGDSYLKYYDILYEGAFGNFRDILGDVTLNLAMGDYLSYLNNQKEDTMLNIQPDENYAREIMQLFTIGLNELNNDGTPKLDVVGNLIPTYNLEDIKQLAKVFTGLYGAALDTNVGGDHVLGRSAHLYNWDLPMVMDSNYHDTSEKTLPDGIIIPAGQTDMTDINMALDWLFNHDNVGPFIARRLIQQLVKSNPTPEYINRVATAFNNNGSGVRGDMGAVFKAVLLDPEARGCEWITHPHAGKLLQPIERYINLFKAFNISTPSGKFRFIDNSDIQATRGQEDYAQQSFLRAPSVFNFFSPFYAESEFVDTAGLVSPEFEILNSITSMHHLNRTRDMIERMGRYNGSTYTTAIQYTYRGCPFVNFTDYYQGTSIHQNNSDKPELDFSKEVCICENQSDTVLLDHLDVLLCRGQLSDQTKNSIINHINTLMTNEAEYEETQLSSNGSWYAFNTPLLAYDCLQQPTGFNCLRKVKEMVYLIAISPDYIILK